MNGRHARKLRKVMGFEPHSERHYKCLNNANNFMLGNDGQPKRVGGTIVEVTKEGLLVTTRSRYKYMKEQWYGRSF